MSASRIHTKWMGTGFMAMIVIKYTVWMELGATEAEAVSLLIDRLPNK